MEKRKCKRKIKRLNILFTNGKEELKGISSDFSCNGLFIRTRNCFPIGTKLEMKLEFDNGSEIPLTGIVKRALKTQISIHKSGMGIRLSSTPAEYDALIKELYQD
jgi:Tfp pilus assembly protein PilZ